MSSLINILAEHAARGPDQPFATVVCNGVKHKMTYGSVWTDSQGIASFLIQSGVCNGEVVIIMMKHGPKLYQAFLGAMTIGAVPSFMPYPTVKQNPELFWSAHKVLFERIRPKVVLVYDEIKDEMERIVPEGTLVLSLSDRTVDKETHSLDLRGSGVSEVAFLQHSSGTTGLKKGVMLTHEAVLRQIDGYAQSINFGPKSIIASWLPLYHDMGMIACFMLPMIVGAHVIHLDPFEWVGSPLTLLDEIDGFRATHVWLPNFAFNHLAMARRFAKRSWDLSSLQAIINCSEPCKIESMKLFEETYADCGVRQDTAQVCYAMAESVFAISQTQLHHPVKTLEVSRDGLTRFLVEKPTDSSDIRRLASCGTVIKGLAIRIVDDSGVVKDDEQIGEICVSGACLYSGYYLLPDVTSEKLRNGWHHTGDLGFIQNDHLYVTGRKDDLIIVRGRNYYAHDIEAIVSQTPGVKPGRCVVFAVETPALGTSEAVCLVELQDGAEVAEVRRAVKIQVEGMSGLLLGKVSALPSGSLYKTTSGKISRSENQKAYLAGRF